MASHQLSAVGRGADGPVTIAPMEPEHVRAVAHLHCATLRGLLSELGVSAATAYYDACTRGRLAAAFVAIEDGAVQGFVLGASQPAALRREVLRTSPIGVFRGMAVGILRRPRALIWLVRSRVGPVEGQVNTRVPELTYLAVAPGLRGGGIGRQLVHAFTGAMRRAGVGAYELSVDDDNSTAIGFYERLGFSQSARYREFGAGHVRYTYRIE